MLDLAFHLDFDWEVGRISREHPRVQIVERESTGGRFLAEVRGPDAGSVTDAVEALARKRDDRERFVELLHRDPRRALVLFEKGSPEASYVLDDVAGTGVVALKPLRLAAGWESYRLLAPSREAAAKARDALAGWGDVKLARMREGPGDLDESPLAETLEGLLRDLTMKQLEALGSAVAKGYYATPRHTTLAELASSSDVARSTFDEHLRKGEGKLLEALVPLLASVAWRSGEEGNARTSHGPPGKT